MPMDEGGGTVFKIKGSSYDQCREKLYHDYGANYVIVDRHTTLKPGFLWFGQKEMVEVSYIVKQRGMASRSDLSGVPMVSSADEEWRRNREELLRMTAGKSIKSIIDVEKLDTRIDNLEKNIVQHLQQMKVTSENKHTNIAKIEELLEHNEFSFGFINSISNRIRDKLSSNELDDFEFVQRQVIDWIGESIVIAKERTFRPPHIIVVVGPTGVGKTTTIAKLAANKMLDAKENGQTKPNLRIITIDRTRVGAMEQIGRYGDLMSVRVDKAESASDVKAIYEDCMGSADCILIDTSGYSPNDAAHIGQMKTILDVEGIHLDVYLAVAASTKGRDIENIIQNYEPFAFDSVIVTKCDETKQYGNVISALHGKRKSISYITDGQRVPHNIRRADVIYFLTRLIDFAVDRPHIDDKFGAK